MAEKGKGIMDKGPGDYKGSPKPGSFRGDSGDSSAKGGGEGKSEEIKG